MRAGMQTLLRLLRHEPQTASVSESEWLAVLTIAEEENLLPWIAAHLIAMAGQVPDSISRSAAEIRREAQRKAFAWSAALTQMLAAFHRRGIQAISLKGPWLAQRLYGDATLRACSDLDFLVRPSDWAAVEDMLRESGFSPLCSRDQRHRHWHHAGIHIEPHFRLTAPFDVENMDCEDVWSRAQFSKFGGVPGWLLSPADELLFLCIHAARHCFERLSILLDLSFAFRQLAPPNTADFGGLGSDFKDPLALCWMMARRLESPAAHPEMLPHWFTANRRLEKICDRVWEHCMLHPGTNRNRRPNHLYCVQLETPGWRRLRRRTLYTWFIITPHSERDIAFASRFHLHRNWQIWMLRPVRLLIKAARLALSRGKDPQGLLLSGSTFSKPRIIPSMKGTAS